MNNKLSIEELATFCKKKGFVFQAAEIYGGLSGFFDFGPLGVELKNNIKNEYYKEFVQKREDMVAQDGSIITNPLVWKASGHLDSFGDLVLTTKDSKTKLRADHFIEDLLKIPADGMSAKDINELIKKHNLKYNGEDFQEIKDFNLLFPTKVGADENTKSVAYLRGETCQSIFPNFKSIFDVSRAKLPFGIAQIGKAFRNEISPRDFLFRTREFEQMEIEYFFDPKAKFDLLEKKHLDLKVNLLSAKNQDNDSNRIESIKVSEMLDKKMLIDIHAYWLCEFMFFLNEKLGISFENLRLREHVKTELSHYSSATFDIDYRYPFGFKEMGGFANRGSFDLGQHQSTSKQKLEIFNEETKSKLLPHVIEPSIGVERIFVALICEAYNNESERGNVVLNLSPKIAPYKVAVFPLMNKDELTNPSREIYNSLIDEEINSFYDKSGSVGKRYARQDEIGTPYCITVDYEAIEDGDLKGTVTIRDRDSTEQKRIKISEVSDVISKLVKGKIKFSDLE